MDDPIKPPSSDGTPDDAVPEGLASDLAGLYAPGEPIEISPAVDEHVARMAHWKLSGRVVASAGKTHGLSWAGGKTRPRVFPMRLMAMSAAAAAILLVVLITPRMLNRTPAPTNIAQNPPVAAGATQIALHGDIDQNGSVDVVDALLLSKLAAGDASLAPHLAGLKSSTNCDLNADGVIDQQDALSIRDTIVKLEGGAG